MRAAPFTLDAGTLAHLNAYARREYYLAPTLEERFVQHVVDALADMEPEDAAHAIDRGWPHLRDDFENSIADEAEARLEA